jgi:hypothetical protein
MKIKGVFPIWALVAIVGTILCFAMLILTEHHTKPRYHSVKRYILFLIFRSFLIYDNRVLPFLALLYLLFGFIQLQMKLLTY